MEQCSVEIKELKCLSFSQESAQPEACCQSWGEGFLGRPGWSEWKGHSPPSMQQAWQAK